MKKRKVGIIGCGHILVRHLESIMENSKDYELVAVCDINPQVISLVSGLSYLYMGRSKDNQVPGFTDYKEMLKQMKGKMDFVVIATPNHLHYEMAIESLKQGCDVLVEKPVAFEASKVKEIQKLADKLGREAYCVLQVRYNPTVAMLKEVLKRKLLGKIRSVCFTQRWQRPLGYFKDWRGSIDQGGRSLYEYGIHYLDIVQGCFGVPEVKATSTFNHKHMDIPFEDTLYSIVQYENGASGTVEVNVCVEPSNLECSISVMGSKGFLKISGKALDLVERASFETDDLQKQWEKIQSSAGKSISPNSYGTHVGSCPNHPQLYTEIAKGRGFRIIEAMPSIKFIENIYAREGK